MIELHWSLLLLICLGCIWAGKRTSAYNLALKILVNPEKMRKELNSMCDDAKGSR